MAGYWTGKRVLITGHTGFKGSWLSLWLASRGAQVSGFALDPPSQPNLFEVARVALEVRSHRGDIGDLSALRRCLMVEQPEVVFHLAAQSLVRRSYADPVGTYRTNVLGTVNVLEAARLTPGVRVIVNVTSDKCYENRGFLGPFRETDPMGGSDPYSSSKGCAELVSAAYHRSFFSDGGQRLASARAGNVIGGGDWAEDRLLPDCMRALLMGKDIELRNPSAVRPWQHVLEPLAGYLLLAEKLDAPDGADYAGGYNFGPSGTDCLPVEALAGLILSYWPGPSRLISRSGRAAREAHSLTLDSTLSCTKLGWRNRLSLREAVANTVTWFQAYQSGQDMKAVTRGQIADYERRSEITSEPPESRGEAGR